MAVLTLAAAAVAAFADTVQERFMNQAVEVARKPLDPVEFKLEDLNGTTRTLGSCRGKMVFSELLGHMVRTLQVGDAVHAEAPRTASE